MTTCRGNLGWSVSSSSTPRCRMCHPSTGSSCWSTGWEDPSRPASVDVADIEYKCCVNAPDGHAYQLLPTIPLMKVAILWSIETLWVPSVKASSIWFPTWINALTCIINFNIYIYISINHKLNFFMRIVLRYYQLPLTYKSRLVTVWRINTLNNPALSDPPIPAHVFWGEC